VSFYCQELVIHPHHDTSHRPWCEQLLARLPELSWKLSKWPKNYRSFLSHGLFFQKPDWQPQDAILEIEQGIKILQELPANSQKARFLGVKILQQINALVRISQEIQGVQQLDFRPGLTRRQHIQSIELRIHALEIQHQALVNALAHTKHPQSIQSEIEELARQQQHLQKLRALA